MTKYTERSTLRLEEGGLWVIRSASATLCYLDLDSRHLLRVRGQGSPSFAYDGMFVALVEVESVQGDSGVIRVGDRHRYVTDPGGKEYRWWVPRTCLSIEPLALEEFSALTTTRSTE